MARGGEELKLVVGGAAPDTREAVAVGPFWQEVLEEHREVPVVADEPRVPVGAQNAAGLGLTLAAVAEREGRTGGITDVPLVKGHARDVAKLRQGADHAGRNAGPPGLAGAVQGQPQEA